MIGTLAHSGDIIGVEEGYRLPRPGDYYDPEKAAVAEAEQASERAAPASEPPPAQTQTPAPVPLEVKKILGKPEHKRMFVSSLKVKIGDDSFEAEGDADVVNEAFQKFMKMIGNGRF